jgi:hypothetical protein
VIHKPFYSDALRGWRIENGDNKESIVISGKENESEANKVYNLARKQGWKAATNREREFNLQEEQRRYEAEQERRRAQQDNPR